MEQVTDGKRRRVLVSEDCSDLAGVLRLCLEMAGYDARTSADALDTLALARSWRPDLITTDIVKTPAMGGLEMIWCLKADEQTRGIPVIAVSATIGRDDGTQQALCVGACAVLAKPLHPADYVRLVGEVLGP